MVPIRLEAACRRGGVIGAASYRSIASILKTGLDKAFMPDPEPDADPIPSRQHPRPWLLPLTNQKETSCSPTTPPNASLALGLPGMAKALDDQQRQPDTAAVTFEVRLGLMIDREV